jgi:carbamoyl-phosphate synthase large subunit
MKSVGEAMAIGRTFKEALQKGLRALELKKSGLESLLFKNQQEIRVDSEVLDKIKMKLRQPNAERIFYIGDAFRLGLDIEAVYGLTKIDRWFLHNIKEIIDCEKELVKNKAGLTKDLLKKAKDYGFSDQQLAKLWSMDEKKVRDLRKSMNITVDFKLVDTCAAEFKAATPYFYSTYDQ